MKKFIVLAALVSIILFLGRSLNPSVASMFEGHDSTQGARILQFILNIRYGTIPPRLAPNFSFNLGYPVLNFYAPAVYWIAAVFGLMGVSIPTVLKITYLLVLLIGFLGCLFFLRSFFRFYPSLYGALLYITSLYVASDIFVRANLAEVFFIAVFPWAFYAITKLARAPSAINFMFSAIVLSILFTSHNLFSLLSIGILFTYLLLFPNKFKNSAALVVAFLLGSYFLVPFLFESHLTYASQVATLTHYTDHFLCPIQLWQSQWGFAGSAPGCVADGMSFMIGKMQELSLVLGLGVFIFSLREQSAGLKSSGIFFFILTLLSLFMTTYQSRFVWDIFSYVLSPLQFPWRFTALALPGIAFFGAYFWTCFSGNAIKYLILAACALLFFFNAKYFTRAHIPLAQYTQKYLSASYVQTQAAHDIPEYLPRTADYMVWRKLGFHSITSWDNKPVTTNETNNIHVLNNNPFEKIVRIDNPDTIRVNIHYFPYWHIYKDSTRVDPHSFDSLGRPLITLSGPATITIVYQQTFIETLATIISVVTLLSLGSWTLVHYGRNYRHRKS